MNYIIFDLEFNSFYNFDNSCKRNFDMPFEIMQIGAIRLNEKFEITGTFERNIKPTVYKKVNPYVHKVTHIYTSDLEDKLPFDNIFKKFKKWMGDDYILCTWSISDIEVLENNCKFFNIECINFDRLIDMQEIFCRHFDLTLLPPLERAILTLRIPLDLPFHTAISDAHYTYRILKEMLKLTELTFVDMLDYRQKQADREQLRANRSLGSLEKITIKCPKCGRFARKKKGIYSPKSKPSTREINGSCHNCKLHIKVIIRFFIEDSSYYIKRLKTKPFKEAFATPIIRLQDEVAVGLENS